MEDSLVFYTLEKSIFIILLSLKSYLMVVVFVCLNQLYNNIMFNLLYIDYTFYNLILLDSIIFAFQYKIYQTYSQIKKELLSY
jgi:hypothetical protein